MPTPRWEQLKHYRLLAGIIALVLLAALPILTYPMGRDQAMYANIARVINAGGTPFVDMWDIKPPPIYYIYALGLRVFGTTTASIRAIDLALIPVGMVGIYLIGRMLSGQVVGSLAALLYGVSIFNDDFQNLTQSDALVTVLLIWAAYSTLRAAASESGHAGAWRWAAITGALCGLILWFKQYYLFFVLALVLYQLGVRRADWRSRALRRADWRSRALGREVLAFCAGGLLTGGACLLVFWQQGLIGEMLIIAQGTAAYNAQGYDFGAFIGNMRHYLTFRWQVWAGVMIGAALWLPTRWIDRTPRAWALVGLWLAGALAFTAIQAKGFDTHWIPALPALALFAAGAIVALIDKLSASLPLDSSIGRGVLYSMTVILFIGGLVQTTYGRAWLYLSGQETRIAYYDRFQANDLKPEQSLQVADYLRQRVQAGDTLYIWGFRPEVYYMANLRPATRFQAHFPLVGTWYPQAWQQENVDLLWAARPPYALVLEDDYMPWVTNRHEDSHQLLQAYTELNNWLIANYDRVDQIGDFIIWKRQNTESASAPPITPTSSH